MRTYGQYCPVARASEGSGGAVDTDHPPRHARRRHHLHRDRRGLPGHLPDAAHHAAREPARSGWSMLPASLRTRLPVPPPHRGRRDLGAVMAALGTWGERWIELAPEHLDPGLVLHAWAGRFLARERLPKRRVVVPSTSGDSPKKKGPVVDHLPPGNARRCARPPGLRGRSVRRGGRQGPDRMAPWPHQVGGQPPSRSDPRAWTIQARPGAPTWNRLSPAAPHEGRPATASGFRGSALEPRSRAGTCSILASPVGVTARTTLVEPSSQRGGPRICHFNPAKLPA